MQLIEPGPDLGPVVVALESDHQVGMAICDLTQPELEGSEAQLCRRVQRGKSDQAFQRIRAAEINPIGEVAPVAYTRHHLQPVGGS